MPLSSQLSLASSPRSASQARRWVRRMCTELGRSDLIEAAEVGVSELVANAVIHGKAPITVRLRGTPVHPRVEVLDASLEAPVPPAPETELTSSVEDLHLLTTVGRGLAMVARSAIAWGASIEDDGKVVWFEPAPEFREEGDVEWVIDHAHEEVAEELGEASTTVCLLGLDVILYQTLNRQYYELRRELRLLALAHEDEYPLARDLSAMFTNFERQFPTTYFSQLAQAKAQGRTTIDLEMPVMAAASPIFVTMSEMFDMADAFCRAERLLSLERTPRERAFHNWMLSEVVRQIDGEAPRAWRLAANAGRSSHVG